MANARDFESITSEYVACSRRADTAYERLLGTKKNGGVVLWRVDKPPFTLAEILALDPEKYTRQHRGEIGVIRSVDPSCPHCGYRFVYECPHCARLSCCGDIVRNPCLWCGAVGTGALQPERPEREAVGAVVWTAWLEFNEWVYDLMTRKNRPKTMAEAEETYRKLKKP